MADSKNYFKWRPVCTLIGKDVMFTPTLARLGEHWNGFHNIIRHFMNFHNEIRLKRRVCLLTPKRRCLFLKLFRGH